MKWTTSSDAELIARQRELERWHSVFAFLPHRTADGQMVWLQRIERRCLSRTILGSPVWDWRLPHTSAH